jgi:hypothetical protein
MCCLSQGPGRNALLHEPTEGRAGVQKHKNPQHRHDDRQRDTAWRHQQVKEENIDYNRSQQRQRQRNVAIEQKENCTDQLDNEYHGEEVRNEERPHELARDTCCGGHGKEMKEAVQSKDQKDEAEKETSDDRSNFMVSSFV